MSLVKAPVLTIVGAYSIADAAGFNFYSLEWSRLWLPTTWFYEFIASRRPFSLVFGALLLYFVAVHISHKGIPLSIRRHEVQVMYESPDGDRAVVTESSDLRANHPNAKGFFQEFYSDGSISDNGIDCRISHCKSETLKTGSTKRWEVLQIFDEPLPFSWMNLKTQLATRTVTVRHQGALKNKKEWWEVHTARYPRKNIKIVINFHPDNPPMKDECQAFTIEPTHAVTPRRIIWLPVGPDRRERLQVDIPYSFNERHRVIWEVSRVYNAARG